jgi:signal transduction histidine kinase
MHIGWKSLGVLVAGTLVTVMTIVLGIYSIVTYRAYALRQRTTLVTLTEIQAEETSVALTLPVWNIDRPQIDRVLQAMARPRSVYALAVTSAGETRGRIRNDQWKMVPWDGSNEPPGMLVREKPIVFSGSVIGKVRVVVSPRFLEDDLRAARVSIIAPIIGMDVVLVVCIHFLLWRIVVRPLQSIERFAAAISAGAQVQAPPASPMATELVSLHSSLETTIRLLDRRFAEVQEEMVLRFESEQRFHTMEEKLRQAETLSLVGALVAGVAHEVRNPLFGISATIDALEAELGEQLEADEYMLTLRNDVARLNRLMTDLLEYGRPQSSARLPQRVEPLIAEAVRICTPRARERHIEIRQNLDGLLPPISIDGDRMLQVLKNVVENAIEFSPEGTAVEISAHSEGGDRTPVVVFTISDRGSGFHSEDLPHVFKPFYTRRKGGSGLGLAIVYKVVTEHGGSVSAANGPAGGGQIEIRLPQT